MVTAQLQRPHLAASRKDPGSSHICCCDRCSRGTVVLLTILICAAHNEWSSVTSYQPWKPTLATHHACQGQTEIGLVNLRRQPKQGEFPNDLGGNGTPRGNQRRQRHQTLFSVTMLGKRVPGGLLTCDFSISAAIRVPSATNSRSASSSEMTSTTNCPGPHLYV